MFYFVQSLEHNKRTCYWSAGYFSGGNPSLAGIAHVYQSLRLSISERPSRVWRTLSFLKQRSPSTLILNQHHLITFPASFAARVRSRDLGSTNETYPP